MTISEHPAEARSPEPRADSLRRGVHLDLTVEDLAFGGKAIARVDGFVVFVENALPGDRVRARIYRRRRQYAEARAEQILEPGAERIPPLCSHAEICGGCRFQDLAYGAQLRHKQRQVDESLARLGRVSLAARPVIAAPNRFNYRNKMEYSFGRDTEGCLTLGLHRRGFFDRPFDLDRCHIATPVSSEIVAHVRAFARAEGLAPYDTRRHDGLLRYLVVREGTRTGELMVNLVASETHVSFRRLAASLTERFPSIRSVALNLTRRRAQVAVGEEEQILAGGATITEVLGGVTFEISSASFFQTNTAQAERLLEAVLEGLDLGPGARVVDLYCGIGTFTLPIARRAAAVIGIDSSDVAIQDAARNAARNGVSNAEFIAGEAVSILRETLGLGRRAPVASAGGPGIHAVLADPPRAGLHPGVVSRLVELGAPRLVYVSCNPATLARDLGVLCESRYRVLWVQPVDMFPHTPHIECVAVLDRTDPGTTGSEESRREASVGGIGPVAP